MIWEGFAACQYTRGSHTHIPHRIPHTAHTRHHPHAPVAVEQAGEGLPVRQRARAAVGQRLLAVHDRDGHLAPVVGSGLEALAGQRGGVVVGDLHLVGFGVGFVVEVGLWWWPQICSGR